MTQAVETLWESRKQLMYTYIFAYGIESHNQKEIFEGNQNDLERATEALSQYLEEELTKDNADQIKINVLNKSKYGILNLYEFECLKRKQIDNNIDFILQLLPTTPDCHAGTHF